MKLSLHQQIINFIDEKDGATFGEIIKQFKPYGHTALLAFDDLLDGKQIRQTIADKNLGTYTYKLAV